MFLLHIVSSSLSFCLPWLCLLYHITCGYQCAVRYGCGGRTLPCRTHKAVKVVWMFSIMLFINMIMLNRHKNYTLTHILRKNNIIYFTVPSRGRWKKAWMASCIEVAAKSRQRRRNWGREERLLLTSVSELFPSLFLSSIASNCFFLVVQCTYCHLVWTHYNLPCDGKRERRIGRATPRRWYAPMVCACIGLHLI